MQEFVELQEAVEKLNILCQNFSKSFVMGRGVTFEEVEPTLDTACLCRKCGDVVLCRGIHDPEKSPHEESMCQSCSL